MPTFLSDVNLSRDGDATNEVVTKAYVDGKLTQATADGLYLGKTGAQTISGAASLTLDSTGTASMILDRKAASNYAHFEFRTNGAQKWTAGTRNGEGENWSLFNNVTSQRPILVDATTDLITLRGDPTSALHAATKQYTDTKLSQATADARYLQLSGGTMSGDVYMSAPAGAARGIGIATAGSLRWTIGKGGEAETGGNAGSMFTIDAYDDIGGWLGRVLQIDRINGIVQAPFGVHTEGKQITGVGDPTYADAAANKQYVDAADALRLTQATADTRYLQLTGGTVSGNLSVSGDSTFNYSVHTYGADMGGYTVSGVGEPSSPTDAATKQYVDERAAPNEVYVGPTEPTDPLVEYWVDPTGAGGTGVSFLPTTGGTVTGNLTVQGDTNAAWLRASLGADMASQKITNVADPTVGTDAANMAWVENRNPPILVLGPSDPVPGGTATGTIIIRTA